MWKRARWRGLCLLDCARFGTKLPGWGESANLSYTAGDARRSKWKLSPTIYFITFLRKRHAQDHPLFPEVLRTPRGAR